MNGTLALWYEELGRAVADAGRAVAAPSLHLHVNMWRDLDENFNFLDLGFLLADVKGLGRLYLYLPAHVAAGCVHDLSTALKDQDTLNAVFNEVSTIGPETDDYFTVNAGRPREKLIHRIDPAVDIDVSYITNPGRPGGTLLALNSACCRRIVDAAAAAASGVHQYVRLRINLRAEARNLFTTIDAAPGVGFSLSQDFLETTEFRLNEQRSYPTAILQRANAGEMRLRSVHYFLIRSRSYQLSSQHQTFRKVRNLERDIWTSYLKVGRDAAKKRRRGPDAMIIYQWREVAEQRRGEGTEQAVLDDFIAYASFRVVKSRVVAYVVAAFAVGGVGSALCNVAVALIGPQFVGRGWRRPPPLWSNVGAALMLVVLCLIPTVLSLFRDGLRRWRARR